MYGKFLKRGLDLLISLVSLIVLSPVLLVIAVLIKLDSKGPVFFRQKRVGRYKRLFMIYKFRTMRFETPGNVPTHLLGGANAYITRVGRFLRKTSLDELPQLINILRGEMSLVGPRPALYNQYDLIAERDRYKANDVLPGLTGWAQVNGRDELQIPVKAKFDGEYARNLRFSMDVKCVYRTVLAVLRHDGVVEGAQPRSGKEKQNDQSL